jgi:alkanesulfonate monooxygenase
MLMSVEFIGYVGHFNSSETVRRSGPAVDVQHIETVAKAHEDVGFDRALVAFHSNSAESILIGQHIAHVTERLGLMIAHRPGFTAPTLAARQLATLDQFSRGRVAVHIITGGNDVELAQDGDHLTKDERYARTSEYLDVVRQEWTATAPFDYDGRYYQVKRGFGDVKPYQAQGIPVYFGGASAAAIPVAGKHADVYALWGETYDQVRELVARIRTAAEPFGRTPKFSLSLRPVLADTEEKAWAKAILFWNRHGSCGRMAVMAAPPTMPGSTTGTRRRSLPMKAPVGCWLPPRRVQGWTSDSGPALPR